MLLDWAGHDEPADNGTIDESPAPPHASPFPTFLSTTFPATIGYSSGWSVAYLTATVITGLWLLSMWLTPVSRQVATHSLPPAAERQLAPEPLPASVGRITGMVDCKWNGGSRVSLGQKVDLASGLMEITYDTGAKVILQGPVTYEVEANGGYLAVGKLTGKLEKNDKRETLNAELSDRRSSFIVHRSSFVIRTPTATVTDLGTEFGVEVDKSGVTETNVFVGAVQVVRIGGKDAADQGAVVIRTGQFARVTASKGASVSVGQRRPDAMAKRFARAIPKKVSAADDYAKLVLSMRPFAYYRMERPTVGQDQNVILDSATGGHHGTLHFAEGYYNSEPWRPGRFGDSLGLRGEFAGDYVDLQDFPSTDTNQLSVSTWVYYGAWSRDALIAGGGRPRPYSQHIATDGSSIFNLRETACWRASTTAISTTSMCVPRAVADGPMAARRDGGRRFGVAKFTVTASKWASCPATASPVRRPSSILPSAPFGICRPRRVLPRRSHTRFGQVGSTSLPFFTALFSAQQVRRLFEGAPAEADTRGDIGRRRKTDYEQSRGETPGVRPIPSLVHPERTSRVCRCGSCTGEEFAG